MCIRRVFYLMATVWLFTYCCLAKSTLLDWQFQIQTEWANLDPANFLMLNNVLNLPTTPSSPESAHHQIHITSLADSRPIRLNLSFNGPVEIVNHNNDMAVTITNNRNDGSYEVSILIPTTKRVINRTVLLAGDASLNQRVDTALKHKQRFYSVDKNDSNYSGKIQPEHIVQYQPPKASGLLWGQINPVPQNLICLMVGTSGGDDPRRPPQKKCWRKYLNDMDGTTANKRRIMTSLLAIETAGGNPRQFCSECNNHHPTMPDKIVIQSMDRQSFFQLTDRVLQNAESISPVVVSNTIPDETSSTHMESPESQTDSDISIEAVVLQTEIENTNENNDGVDDNGDEDNDEDNDNDDDNDDDVLGDGLLIWKCNIL